jgi:hypothetical protein
MDSDAMIFIDLAAGVQYLMSAHVYDTSLVDMVVANEHNGAENVCFS